MAHLDLYRLGSLAEEDPGVLDDYLTPERIGFVEWPEIAEPAGLRVAARVHLEHARRRPAAADGDAVNVLGFDTSTAATAVCVERADGESFEYVPAAEELDGRPGHASELLPRVAAADGGGRAGLGRRRRRGGGGGAGGVHRPAHRRGHRAGAGRSPRTWSCDRCRRCAPWPRGSTRRCACR